MAFTKKGVLKSFGHLIKTFFQQKIIDIVLLMIIYVELIVLGLTLIGFWELPLLKDTILWTVFVGFLLLMKMSKINSKNGYLNSILKDSLKGIIIIEFIANFYNFSLLVELILIPIMTFVGVSQVFTQNKPEYKPVEKLFNGITSLFGIVVLTYTIYRISREFREFANLLTLKSFLNPIILTFLFIPFLYLVSLWSLYENVILTLSRRLKKKNHKRYLKKKMFRHFLFNRTKLKEFHKEMRFEAIMNKEDINRILKTYNEKE
ncbi:hypothetical protein HSX10_17450 [Winogradskyella undariae]|uniref:hypothetical protein n=1 Tax=Winogradskyella undariae TaxID=1285465 RepID=UPI00156B92D2|nr:hypothetical protein [Winogradskyella undariae]NRR93363.1 hypothetical protein [Winogradskyella undariae]